jgi:hypothetical protein
MKKLTIVAMAALLSLGSLGGTPITAISQTGCVPAPSGMVSWWPGDGDADDIVGGNNGTLQNGATFAPGKVGQAFSFDGANAVVQVANNPAWNFGTSEFTIDAWVNFNSTVGFPVFVAHDEGGGATNK